ncbi:T9SS type A sorting domain-containing protein [Flavobacterium sp. CYK-4]|uniref:T9SS type A sorting domain-containing protein n=1 Tax=Flavobacterium lotistagni TaxID=2709660 RepID=UPI001407ACC7|nr:T9SS type A sorting domain-containing protein [Flavobacterium lotistagni]NHM06296.1 T9SS type A sorting domain-containing protein [Flavobacterium lotistagni]
MKTKLLVLALAVSVSVCGQNLFQDDFSSYTTGADLHNQGQWTHNSSLPGGLGAALGALPNNADVLASPVAFLDYGASANSVAISPDSDGVGVGFTAVTDGDLYVGFVLNLSAAQANNNSDFFRVMSGNNLNTTFRLYAINTGFSYNIAIAKGANGNPLATSALSYSYNEDHLVIVKYSQLPGTSDDVVSLYVDPVYANGVPASTSAITNTGLDQSGSIDRLTFRMNWTNGMPTGKAGLVSVGRNWDDLTFVPLSTTQFNQSQLVIDSRDAKIGRLVIQSEIDLGEVAMKIINLNGAVVDNQKINLNSGANSIQTQPIAASGIYLLQLTDSKGDSLVRKIVIQ